MRITKEIRERLRSAKAINSGGALNDSKVSLSLYSEHINIAALTALLGCEPTHSQVKGQIRRPPHGKGPAKLGHWFLDAPKPLRFEQKVRYLLDATPSSSATWRLIARNHDVQLRCAVFMHCFNEGFELPPQTVAEIGKRKWKFLVDIYGAEGSEVLEAFLAPASQARPNNAVNVSVLASRRLQRRKRRASRPADDRR